MCLPVRKHKDVLLTRRKLLFAIFANLKKLLRNTAKASRKNLCTLEPTKNLWPLFREFNLFFHKPSKLPYVFAAGSKANAPQKHMIQVDPSCFFVDACTGRPLIRKTFQKNSSKSILLERFFCFNFSFFYPPKPISN